MREVRFRGKRIDNGEWATGFYGYKEETNKHFIMVETVNLNSTSYFTDYEVDPETVGQYTGLKDKDDKEIFGGDIVKLIDAGNTFIHEVKWIPENAAFVFDYDNDWFGAEEMPLNQCEVIGNIYENGELLHDTK